MPKFDVTLTRTAYENVVWEVTAKDRDAAEDKVNKVIGGVKRIDAFAPPRGFRFVTSDLNGDEESSWEIFDIEESML